MGLKLTDEFRQQAVRFALTSGLIRTQVADDLAVGRLTLDKWITAYRVADLVSKEDFSLAQENDWLRHENRHVKEERELQNKDLPVLCGPKAMRSRFIEEHRANRLCDVAGVSTRGQCAFRGRPASRKQWFDLLTLAYIKELPVSAWVAMADHARLKS